MPPVVIADGFLVTASGTNLGQPWANVIGVQALGANPLDQTIADAIGTAVRDLYNAFVGNLSDEWALTGVAVYDARPGANDSFDASITQLNGPASSNPLPANAALVATHRTGRRGRSFRGRTYHNGFTVAAIDGAGLFATSVRDAVEAAWADFRTDLAAIGGLTLSHAVLSRTLSEATPVTITEVDGLLDHQDRRKN